MTVIEGWPGMTPGYDPPEDRTVGADISVRTLQIYSTQGGRPVPPCSPSKKSRAPPKTTMTITVFRTTTNRREMMMTTTTTRTALPVSSLTRPPGEAPQGGQHHPATDRGHGEVLTRELPGDSRPQPDSPPKTSDSPWDGQEEWVDHTQGKRGGYYQEDQTQDRGHPPSRNDQVPEWRGYKRDPRRDQRYPDDPREAAGAYWIGPEDWADQRERYDLRYAGDAGYELSQGFDDRWNGQRTGAGHYDSHPRYDPAPPRQGIRPHFQQTAIRFPPQRQSQHWTTFTTTAPPPALSHPSATFHNSADCSRIVVHTSQPQGTEVTSQPQGTEVAGVVSGRLTEESTKPHISLVYLTIIGSFITMFCCPCFGIPALVVSIQEGHPAMTGHKVTTPNLGVMLVPPVLLITSVSLRNAHQAETALTRRGMFQAAHEDDLKTGEGVGEGNTWKQVNIPADVDHGVVPVRAGCFVSSQ
ncbi:uncharacterized protein LOC143300818 [Babylonia areolata]|uniref:uncharacterized protein LOC143300818 n=1 Tax=Babylonia areolata TaxID=304850 RepID=UPI003FD35B9E